MHTIPADCDYDGGYYCSVLAFSWATVLTNDLSSGACCIFLRTHRHHPVIP